MKKILLLIFLLCPISLWAETQTIKNAKVIAGEGAEVIVQKGAVVHIMAGAVVHIHSGAQVTVEPGTLSQNQKQLATGQNEEPQNLDEEIEKIAQDINQSSNNNSNTKHIGPFKYQVPDKKSYKAIPDISVIGSFTASYFEEDPTDEEGHDPKRTGFTLQEVELALQSVIDPYLRGDVHIGFHEDEVEIEEAYVTTLAFPKGLQVQAGKFYLPFGRQNEKHLEQWAFADNMLPNKLFLSPEGLSEIGIEAAYTFPTPFFLQLQATMSNGDNEDIFNGERKEDFLYQSRLSTGFDLNEEVSLLFGGSGAWGWNDSGEGYHTHLYGADMMLRWKPKAYRSLTWQSEYIHRRYQFSDDDVYSDGGFYSYIDYQFLKRWRAGLRYEQMGLPEGELLNRWRLSPAITFSPSEFSRLRLQFEVDKEKNQESNKAGILQLQFNMGPHGAHEY